MKESAFISIQIGSPFIYKEGYYQISRRITPNTWNFLMMENRQNTGKVCLKSEVTYDMKLNGVLISGKKPVDYAKLRRWRHRTPLQVYNANKENIAPSSSSSDSDEDELYQ